MTNLVKSGGGKIAFRAAEDKTVPPGGLPVDNQQELEWKSSLKNFEHAVNSYKSRSAEGAISEDDAEQVAKAMEQVGTSHTDPVVKAHWQGKAKKFRAANVGERDSILEDIGKGFLILLTAPFLLVAAVLQATGGVLSGTVSILRGLGRLTAKLTYTGSSRKRRAEESMR